MKAIAYIVLVSLLATVLFRALHSSASPTSTQRYLAPAEISLPSTWEQPDFLVQTTLRNVRHSTVDVNDLAPDCGCTAIEPRQFSLKPGESQQLTLHLDTRRSNWLPGEESSEFTVDVIASLFDGVFKQERLKVRTLVIRSPLHVSASRIDFGNDLYWGAIRAERRISVEVVGATRLPQLSVDPPDICELRWEDSTMGETVHDLVITPHSELPLGKFQGTITIECVSPGSSNPGPVTTLSVTGHVIAPIVASPGRLELGLRQLGSVVTRQVTLNSVNDGVVLVAAVDGSAFGMDVRELTEYSLPDRAVYEIRQTIHSTGFHRSQVQFQTDSVGDQPAFTVTVPISYQGVDDREETSIE